MKNSESFSELPEFRTSNEKSKTGFIQGNTFEFKEIKYFEINGEAIFEGDISLGSAKEMQELSSDIQTSLLGIGITGNKFRWPGGIIPFEIDQAVPDQQRIINAIQHWKDRTPIFFVERIASNALLFPNYIRFVSKEGCSSRVGMIGGMQEVSLGIGCEVGQAIHEIGHAVGLWHEQSREDRDNFVRILWENIDEDKRLNFEQQISDGDDIDMYDFNSIMHYSSFAFSKNGNPTIESIGGQQIGQRLGLSSGDIAAVNSIYGFLRNAVIALYNYDNDDTALWVFPAGSSAPQQTWRSGPGNWNWNLTKIAGADVRGAGRSELCALYNYGNGDTALFVFPAGSPAPQQIWRSGAGNFEWDRAKLVAADVRGIGKSELCILYNYDSAGGGDTALFVFPTGSPAPQQIWRSGAGNFEWDRSLV
jgi:hypothetical protein